MTTKPKAPSADWIARRHGNAPRILSPLVSGIAGLDRALTTIDATVETLTKTATR